MLGGIGGFVYYAFPSIPTIKQTTTVVRDLSLKVRPNSLSVDMIVNFQANSANNIAYTISAANFQVFYIDSTTNTETFIGEFNQKKVGVIEPKTLSYFPILPKFVNNNISDKTLIQMRADQTRNGR